MMAFLINLCQSAAIITLAAFVFVTLVEYSISRNGESLPLNVKKCGGGCLFGALGFATIALILWSWT